MLGDSWNKVLEDKHCVCQHLGDPIYVDAAGLGFCSHRPRWIWTNIAPIFTLASTFFTMFLQFDKKVDGILDPNQTFLLIVVDYLPLLALINKVGAPQIAFSTFMIFSQSFAFHDRGLVWCGILTPKAL